MTLEREKQGCEERMNTDYLIFLGLYLFSLMIRTSYELLKKARRVNPKNTMVFAVILVVMCLMWASWFGMCPWIHCPSPYPKVYVGSVLVY